MLLLAWMEMEHTYVPMHNVMHVITACPIHLYHWDTWTEMGRTYVPIYLLSVLSICTTGTHGWKWDVPMYQYTVSCTLPLSRPVVPLGHLDRNGTYLCTNIQHSTKFSLDKNFAQCLLCIGTKFRLNLICPQCELLYRK